GDYSTAVPTAASLNAVGDLVGWKLAAHGVTPNTNTSFKSLGSSLWPEGTNVTLNTVSGHRNTSAAGCPGDHLYSRLSTVRSRTASKSQGHARIGDRVWLDKDGDGTEDSGEPNVELELREDTDGNGSYDKSLGIRHTNAGGRYLFGGLGPGRYRVSVDQDDLPTGNTFPATVFTTTLGAGGSALNADFGAIGHRWLGVGDSTGEGTDDIFWYAPGAAKDYLWTGNGDSTFGTGGGFSVP
ncbi:MAG: hypothetical protein GY798_15720, partial [Hyphomicrobiales bacterium]|nr:hypothetical protein [Hyphomicrobiales bacterium]